MSKACSWTKTVFIEFRRNPAGPEVYLRLSCWGRMLMMYLAFTTSIDRAIRLRGILPEIEPSQTW